MLRLNLLREVIDRQIMLQRAEKLGLMAVDSEVEARLKEYRAPYDTDAAFEANLKARSMTLEDLKTELRRALTIEKLFNKEVTSRISVTDAELKAFYEENKASFNLPEQQLHLAQIVVTPKPEVPVPEPAQRRRSRRRNGAGENRNDRAAAAKRRRFCRAGAEFFRRCRFDRQRRRPGLYPAVLARARRSDPAARRRFPLSGRDFARDQNRRRLPHHPLDLGRARRPAGLFRSARAADPARNA